MGSFPYLKNTAIHYNYLLFISAQTTATWQEWPSLYPQEFTIGSSMLPPVPERLCSCKLQFDRGCEHTPGFHQGHAPTEARPYSSTRFKSLLSPSWTALGLHEADERVNAQENSSWGGHKCRTVAACSELQGKCYALLKVRVGGGGNWGAPRTIATFNQMLQLSSRQGVVCKVLICTTDAVLLLLLWVPGCIFTI